MQSKNRLKSERPRAKNDFYKTPIDLCATALNRLADDEHIVSAISVLDPGCGTGVWGEGLYYRTRLAPISLVGTDIDTFDKPDCYTKWLVGDYIDDEFHSCGLLPMRYDLIMGNPPYKLAEEFIRRSYLFLNSGGYVFFLLRLAFLESQKRYFGLFKDWQPKRVYVLSRRPSFFSTNGRRTVDSLSYAMFLWQKGWEGNTELDWLYWDYSI